MLLIISCLISRDNKFYNKDKKNGRLPRRQKSSHNGKVYLQPDPDFTYRGRYDKLQVGDPGGGVHQEEYPIKRYQKGP